MGLTSSDLAQYRPAGATDLDIRLACKGLAGDSCGALNRLCTASETVRASARRADIESFIVPLRFGLFVPPFAEMAEPSRVVEPASRPRRRAGTVSSCGTIFWPSLACPSPTHGSLWLQSPK